MTDPHNPTNVMEAGRHLDNQIADEIAHEAADAVDDLIELAARLLALRLLTDQPPWVDGDEEAWDEEDRMRCMNQRFDDVTERVMGLYIEVSPIELDDLAEGSRQRVRGLIAQHTALWLPELCMKMFGTGSEMENLLNDLQTFE